MRSKLKTRNTINSVSETSRSVLAYWILISKCEHASKPVYASNTLLIKHLLHLNETNQRKGQILFQIKVVGLRIEVTWNTRIIHRYDIVHKQRYFKIRSTWRNFDLRNESLNFAKDTDQEPRTSRSSVTMELVAHILNNRRDNQRNKCMISLKKNPTRASRSWSSNRKNEK